MEVLFITHKYPPAIGGMEKQSMELITRMSRRCKVHTIIYRKDSMSRIGFFWNLKKEVKRMLALHPGIDIIHLNDGLMAAFCPWIFHFTDIPVTATFHGLDIVFPWKYYQKKILPRAKQLATIITVSQASKQAFIKRGFDNKIIICINNGVDHELANLPKSHDIYQVIKEKTGKDLTGKNIIVALGRPVKRKGFSWFLKNVLPELSDETVLLMMGPITKHSLVQKLLLRLIPSSIKNTIQLFLGQSTDQERVLKLLQEDHISGKAFHLGKLEYNILFQLLSAADLFVMPNIRVKGDAEGFGLVALEATLRGTPVLASGIEGIKDAIIDQKNGFLLPSADKKIWVEAITKLLSDKKALTHFGQHAKKYTLSHYDWELMVEEYYKCFKNIVHREQSTANIVSSVKVAV